MTGPTAHEHGFMPATPSDHRPWLWVVTLLSLLYSALVGAARLTGKWDLLWWDDGLLAMAYVFALAHYGALSRAIYDGLGTALYPASSPALSNAADMYFTSRALAFLAMAFSKLSLLLFTRRIFSGHLHQEKMQFRFAYLVTALYSVGAVLLSSAGCRPAQSLVPAVNAVCDGNLARWALITALDVITELGLLALPCFFVAKHRVKPSKRRVVVFVYLFRLVVAAFSVATTATYLDFLRSGARPIDLAPTVAWQEVLLGCSLISSSIPCLRSFLWAFMSSGLMTMYGARWPPADLSAPVRSGTRESTMPRSALASRERPEHPLPPPPRCELRPVDPLDRDSEVDVRPPAAWDKKRLAGAEGEGREGTGDYGEQMVTHRSV